MGVQPDEEEKPGPGSFPHAVVQTAAFLPFPSPETSPRSGFSSFLICRTPEIGHAFLADSST